MTIRRLAESLVVRIAAGEVIERPASVVKELVENSFDAGATEVTVRIEQGGLGLIEVSDNGGGIATAELMLAVERHATSKIADPRDLETIATMGFRGEALAAIAAAGRLTIISRVPDADASRLVVAEDYAPEHAGEGAGLTVEPASRARGTTVIVRDLFARLPARLKFMKSQTAEFGRIAGMLERLALARPDVAIELVRDGRRVFRTDGRGSLRDVVLEIFGAETARALLPVDAVTATGAVSGLISPPQFTRRNRTGFFYHLAGRPIEDRVIAHAITAAYEGLLMGGQFPVVFFGLAVDPGDVDVNVHPAKAEVRFRDTQSIHRLVSQALRAHLQGVVPLPEFTNAAGSAENAGQPLLTPLTPNSTAIGGSGGGVTTPALFGMFAGANTGANGGEVSTTTSGTTSEERLPIHEAIEELNARRREQVTQELLPGALNAPRVPRLRYIGEIAGRYLVADDTAGLVLVDQHAAHERVLFDRLMHDAAVGAPIVHPLLSPVLVELTASDRALVEDSRKLFAAIGFELEAWPDAIAIQGVPSHFRRVQDAARMLSEIVMQLKESAGGKLPEKAPYARLARAACKGAVKGTDRLMPEEAKRLLDDLATTTDPYTCPHGRPTMVRLSLAELDRRFGRG